MMRIVRRYDLALLLSAAFALRLFVWYRLPNVHWGDEIFQFTEPAHRLVFGTGLVTWEWLIGIRSYLLPGVFAGLMAIPHLLGRVDPLVINLPGAIMMAGLGCLPTLCAYGWGLNLSRRPMAVIAGAAAASWSDLVYISPIV